MWPPSSWAPSARCSAWTARRWASRRFDFAICAERPGEPLPTKAGFSITAPHGFDRLAEADLVAVPASGGRDYPEALLQALRDAVDRGAWVLSVCSGAEVLAASGILDGRRCTTHWMYAADLAARHPW